MRTNSLIIIIILGFVALWLTTGVTEYNGTVSGLDGSSRLAAGGIAGPQPWAPALINAEAVAAGSPCRVPYDWIPTPNSPQSPCSPGPPSTLGGRGTEPPDKPRGKGFGLGVIPDFGPYPYPSKQAHPVQEKMSN